jgi:hypothetical protein
VLYIDPGDGEVKVFVMILEVHYNEYTILFTDGKSKRVLESMLSPLPVGIDYMMMSAIERENFMYEQFEKVQQAQLLKRADEYDRSKKGRKGGAPVTNVTPSDPPNHDSNPADNRLPTLGAAAEILNLNEIKARLQDAEVVDAANTKSTTVCVQNFVQVKGMSIH